VVTGDFKAARRADKIAVVPNEPQQLLANPLTDIQFCSREHSRVFLQDGRRHVKARGLGNGEHKRRALKALWLQGR